MIAHPSLIHSLHQDDLNDPQKDLYDVDDETTVITLADWYHPPALGATSELATYF